MKTSVHLICLLFMILTLHGCDKTSEPRKIEEVRLLSKNEAAFPPKMSAPERFGLQVSNHPSQAPITGETLPADSPLNWIAPESWESKAGHSMRLATFIPKGTTQTECAVSMLTGTAGGMESNLNRWRSQLGLPPMTSAEISSLPRLRILDSDAIFVEITGKVPQKDGEIMLLGVICPLPSDTLFIKMTGPAREVESERKNFSSFAMSFSYPDISAP